MLQTLKLRRNNSKNFNSVKEKSLVVECPDCQASITVKNIKMQSNRFCWRCLKEISFAR